MRTRTFVLAGIVVALLLAGVASYYASSHPDGLEYVAERTGFIDSADETATADGPLADYRTRGVDDARVSGGLAGVLGVVLTLLLATGIGFAVRRRSAPDGRSDRGDQEHLPTGRP
ncbi:MAG TPA: PDGLE domain-containing protein [Nocardioides sp.]|uniref:PDGLE domain-containing protein n=1 Tax=Nocardioides sp. TaxID=35761 RepID=UPI002D8019B4|nr:PDGLE domain-containing protein [Nocardioides sp.]HET6653887.1 PDGLE domain-containing protein [Nocardioides sp.]